MFYRYYVMYTPTHVCNVEIKGQFTLRWKFINYSPSFGRQFLPHKKWFGNSKLWHLWAPVHTEDSFFLVPTLFKEIVDPKNHIYDKLWEKVQVNNNYGNYEIKSHDYDICQNVYFI